MFFLFQWPVSCRVYFQKLVVLYISSFVCKLCNTLMSYEARNDRWTATEICRLRQARAAVCAFDLEKYSTYMTQDLQDKLKRLGDPLSADSCVLKPLEQFEQLAISRPSKKAKMDGKHPKQR